MGSTDTRPWPIQIPSQPAIDRPSHESKTHEGAGAKAAAEPMRARTARTRIVTRLRLVEKGKRVWEKQGRKHSGERANSW